MDPGELGMTEYRDSYDDLGEVAGWVHDLGAAWTAELDRRQVVVAERDAGYTYEAVHQAPRDLVWSFMTDPALRPRWQFGVTGIDELPTAPRRGAGTTNHCIHGKDAVVEEVLAWRPPEVLTTRFQMPMPGIPKFTRSEILEVTADGAGTTFTIDLPSDSRPFQQDTRPV